jgi:ketosteroid isomerase-like protein
MSDADRLRALFADWGRGDFTGGPALFADDIRFTATQPEGQIEETGIDGVRGFMTRFLPEWEHYAVELHELEHLGGGRYLATATQHGTGSGSGMDITSPVHIAIEMSGGRMTLLGFFMRSREDALEALAG